MLLGTSLKYQQSGSTRRLVEHQDTFQYVPLTENLEKFLSNPEVLTEVNGCVVGSNVIYSCVDYEVTCKK